MKLLTGKSDITEKITKNEESSLGTELISGLTQLLVLMILKKGPQHGYELCSILEPIYGRRLSPGTIYPLLQRMENKEYIQSRTAVVSGRKRKTYVLTRLGRIAMENAQESLQCLLKGENPNFDEETPGTELLKSLAQFRILLILDESPLHGYELVEELDNYFGKKIALGTIYPSLHRLVEKGFIESKSEWEGDRERKVYELTGYGKAATEAASVEIARIASGEIFE